MDFILFVLVLVTLNAVVTFGTAAFIRSNALCIFAGVAVTELLAALYIVIGGADTPFPDMLLVGVSCIAIVGTPVLIVSAMGFVLLARRLRIGRVAGSKP